MDRYTTQEVLEHGRKLLADAHRAYIEFLEEGYSEDEAYLGAWEGAGANNFDDIAIIWAAGAISLALESEDVREAIEQGVCFG